MHDVELQMLEAHARRLGYTLDGLTVVRKERERCRAINGLAEAITLAVIEAQDAAEVDGLTPAEFKRDLLAQISHILGE